ncbi:MAG: AAA family ATPase [Deltaproteobacteria bacterium]|nr:AAA family ATPase [Deltaproteobacteria bacterium]
MSEGSLTEFTFGPFEIDLARGLLLRDGESVGIRRKPFEVLSMLVQARDRVVTKAELRAAVWPGTSVSDAALTSAVRDLRRCLGEEGRRTPRYVSTVYGRGYRFIHPVKPRSGSSATGGRFVGRRPVFAEAAERAEAAARGTGSVLLLAGEAGIGKTHTALEIARRGEQSGLVIHLGRCLEEAGAPAYWPWTQIVRSVLGGHDPMRIGERYGSSAAEAKRVLPECGGDASGPMAEPTDVEADASRFRVFDGVTNLLRSAAVERPRLLLLDDLHRADKASVLLLRHLMRETAGMRTFIVGAYRDDEVDADHPLQAVLSELHTVGRSVALSGLSPAELARLVAQLCGEEPDEDVLRQLHERTEGNPFFATEIVRALMAEGALSGPGTELRASVSSSEGVRQLVRSRVSRLGDRVVETLTAAAVAGRSFDLDVLTQVRAEIGAPALREDLDAAQAAGLIGEVPDRGARFAFSHILVRDALYDDVPGRLRRALHRAVGLATESLRSGDVEAHVDELARHFGQAAMDGEAERATTYAQRAGLRSFAQAAYDEAVSRFDEALRYQVLAAGRSDAQAEFGLELRAELIVQRARGLWSAGHTEQARQSFAEAAVLARKIDASNILMHAALGYAGRTDATPGLDARVVGLIEEALGRLPDEDTVLRAEALARLGKELYYHPDPAIGQARAREAVAMAERVGDPGALGYTLSALHHTLQRPEVEPHTRLAIADRLIALAEVSGAGDVEAVGLQEAAADLAEMGDRARLEEYIRRYGRIVEALRQPFVRWLHSAYLTMIDQLDGRLEAAETRMHGNFALGQSFGSPSVLLVYSSQLFALRREQGRLTELIPFLAEAADSNATFWGFRAALAAAQLAAQRPGEAGRIVEALCSGGLEDLPPDQNWLGSFGVLASVCAQLGQVAHARRCYTYLQPYRGRLGVVGFATACDLCVDHRLADLARAVGDVDAAEGHYEAALDLHRRAGARLYLAHTQRDFAGLLWKRGRRIDRERAAHLLCEAAETYRELDLPHHRAWMREHEVEGA